MAVLDVELQPGRTGRRDLGCLLTGGQEQRRGGRPGAGKEADQFTGRDLKLGSDASRRGCRFRRRLDGLEIEAEVNDGTDVDRAAARQGEPERSAKRWPAAVTRNDQLVGGEPVVVDSSSGVSCQARSADARP